MFSAYFLRVRCDGVIGIRLRDQFMPSEYSVATDVREQFHELFVDCNEFKWWFFHGDDSRFARPPAGSGRVHKLPFRDGSRALAGHLRRKQGRLRRSNAPDGGRWVTGVGLVSLSG